MACLIAVLLAPRFSRAQDDWEQVPSGGEESGGGNGMAAPSGGGSDASAVANFLIEMRAIKGDTGKPCEVVGTYAHLAATFRDQGVSEQSQQQDIDGNFERSAAEHHVPAQWIRPIESVFHREVVYAYGHPGMSVEQVKVALGWDLRIAAQQPIALSAISRTDPRFRPRRNRVV